MSEIHTADVLASDATDGEVRCTLGDAVNGMGFGVEAAIYSGPLVYRPSEPDDNGDAPTALYVQDSDDAQILATKDVRYADKVGTLDAGDWGLIGNTEARIFCRVERDAIVLYTLNKPADKSMLVDLGGVEGELRIVNGGAVITMTDSEINLSVNGGGGIKINASGVSISGSSVQLVAEVVQLGQLGPGVPPPAIAGSPGVAVQATPPIAMPPASTKVFIAP